MKIKGEKYRLTVIIPVYNESDNIPKLDLALRDFLKVAAVPSKILFIDDGSTDSSLRKLIPICKKHCEYDYVALTENKGLSTALKAGFDAVTTPLVGYMDADLQTSPMDFNLLLKHIQDNALVTGIRSSRKDGLIKRFSSRLANAIRRIFTRDGIFDTGCPLKLMKTEYAKKIPMFKGMHRFLPALIQLQNGKVHQVSVTHYPRKYGKSKFTVNNRIFRTLIDCFVFLWIKNRYINYEMRRVID